MNKVITINLGGRSYSVEEPGYNLLKEYLDNAAKKLEGNPDMDEVLKDFNLAIAEKCDAYLSPSKNVILTTEIEKIIKDMGPVEGEETVSGDSKKQHSTEEKASQKKLYILPDTGVILGVCSGLAAYFDVDVTVVRIIFIALTILTHGAWILIYFIIGMVVPKANTPEEKAEAWGSMRMTAQDIMQRAWLGYEKFKDKGEWKKWKQQMKEEKRKWKQRERSYRNQTMSPFYELMHSIIGMLWVAFIVYISWYGYNHIMVVHDFFDLIGNILKQGVLWLKAHTGQ